MRFSPLHFWARRERKVDSPGKNEGNWQIGITYHYGKRFIPIENFRIMLKKETDFSSPNSSSHGRDPKQVANASKGGEEHAKNAEAKKYSFFSFQTIPRKPHQKREMCSAPFTTGKVCAVNEELQKPGEYDRLCTPMLPSLSLSTVVPSCVLTARETKAGSSKSTNSTTKSSPSVQ